jgi:hypothetical protein
VHNAIPVQILNPCNNLLKVLHCLHLFQPPVFDNEVKELTAFNVLHDEVDALICFNDLVEVDHIGVSQYFQYADLSRDPLDV